LCGPGNNGGDGLVISQVLKKLNQNVILYSLKSMAYKGDAKIAYKKNQFFKFNKRINPLQKTKEVYKQRNKFLEKELKEFSILFLIINNLDIFRSNIELISEIMFSSDLITEFKQKLIDYLLSEEFFDRKKLKLEDFDVKFKDIINLININAPVKIITKNKNEKEIIMMFTEIISEIIKINSL